MFFEIFNSPERIIINQGGTSSGKTYATLDTLFCIAMKEHGQVITVVGQDIPNLKAGAYRDAKTIYGNSDDYQKWFSKPNETDRVFTCRTGSLIEFKSYSDEQDARSGKRDYLFVNEANGIPYPIYWQLATRTRKKIFIDYNPTYRFWVHEELINKSDIKLIISDHRNNPFLSESEHNRIESISDPELFRVYARGLTGKIEGLIYTDWQLVDDLPDNFKLRWIGIDFGFTNDPTAIIDLRLSGGELWIDEIEYRTDLTNIAIGKILKENGINSSLTIVADSAEPKSIAEISNMGFRIEPAQKGQDSVKNGIDILKRYKMNITRRSKNIRKELLAYKWKEDRSGKTINQPVDEFNHALDAIRYVALNKLQEQPVYKKPKVRTTRI
ncbi:MAG: terminase large subunit [Candidatus Azobacteroides sp.]|nr:terminase large subunit [Candidatus Azobacteroides sp.]